MKNLICCTAAVFALLAVPAAAQDKPTLNPNQITVATKRPPLQFDDRRAVIQAALAGENTEQKAPPKFEPKVGDTLPQTMALDVMPQQLVCARAVATALWLRQARQDRAGDRSDEEDDHRHSSAPVSDQRQGPASRRLGGNGWPRTHRPGAGTAGREGRGT